MDTDLVGPSCFQFRFQQGEVRIMSQYVENGVGRLSCRIDPYTPFTVGGMVFQQWQPDVLSPVFPVSVHQCLITLVNGPLADLFVQPCQGRPFFGQNENAGRFLVQPVDEFQKFRFRPHGTQLLDDTEGYAGTAVDCDTCRFVDDQNAVILVQDIETGIRYAFFFPFGCLDWRNADDVSGLQPVCLVDPFFVDTYFSRPEDAVDMAFRNALEYPEQIIVDALPVLVFRHGYQPNRFHL